MAGPENDFDLECHVTNCSHVSNNIHDSIPKLRFFATDVDSNRTQNSSFYIRSRSAKGQPKIEYLLITFQMYCIRNNDENEEISQYLGSCVLDISQCKKKLSLGYSRCFVHHRCTQAKYPLLLFISQSSLCRILSVP